jgi:hypothetical protein
MPAHQLEPSPRRRVEAGIGSSGEDADELERVAEADVADLRRCSQGRLGVNAVDGTAELRNRFPGAHERMFRSGVKGGAPDRGPSNKRGRPPNELLRIRRGM